MDVEESDPANVLSAAAETEEWPSRAAAGETGVSAEVCAGAFVVGDAASAAGA
jgi:hypothetical protein